MLRAAPGTARQAALLCAARLTPTAARPASAPAAAPAGCSGAPHGCRVGRGAATPWHLQRGEGVRGVVPGDQALCQAIKRQAAAALRRRCGRQCRRPPATLAAGIPAPWKMPDPNCVACMAVRSPLCAAKGVWELAARGWGSRGGTGRAGDGRVQMWQCKNGCRRLEPPNLQTRLAILLWRAGLRRVGEELSELIATWWGTSNCWILTKHSQQLVAALLPSQHNGGGGPGPADARAAVCD